MALRKCKECDKEISTEAKLCPNCGAPVKKPTSKIVKIGGGLILFFLFLGFIGSLFNQGNATQSTENTDKQRIARPKKETVAVAATPSWTHGENKDQMSGKVSKFATKKSDNTVNFEFPYQGVQRGTIMAMDDAVLFYVQKGQVICNGGSEFGTCLVKIKFDDNKERYINAKTLGDNSTTIKFTEPGFLKNLKQSKKLMIEVEVFHNGYPVFIFDVRGLNK